MTVVRLAVDEAPLLGAHWLCLNPLPGTRGSRACMLPKQHTGHCLPQPRTLPRSGAA